MSLAALLTRLQAVTLPSDPEAFSAACLEVIRAFSLADTHGPLELTDAEVTVVRDATHALLQCPSLHIACIGFALASTNAFYLSRPSIAASFFSCAEGRLHGAWSAVRAVDAADATPLLLAARGNADRTKAAQASVHRQRVQGAFRCFVASVLDYVARGVVPPSAVQPCVIERLKADITRCLRVSTPQAAQDSLSLLQQVIVHCPSESLHASAVPFLLQVYIDHAEAVSAPEVAKTLAQLVAQHGMRGLRVTSLAPLFFPYVDVFGDISEPLLRARDVLLLLPSSWAGVMLLAS